METTAATFSPNELMQELEGLFTRYLALAPRLPLVLTLWSLATYLFEVFDSFPYLAITSPTMRCGKTRLAELLELACAKPIRIVGLTEATLFRIVDARKPTLIVDEAEVLRGRDERSSAVRAILNAGNRKGQTVARCVGGGSAGANFSLREFQTYCPKVVALIGNLPSTLLDRSIPIVMRRRTQERIDRFRFGRARQETDSLRKQIESWARAYEKEVERWYYDNDLRFLQDRDAELWLPLFAVCTITAPHRFAELEAVAQALAATKSAGEPTDMGIKLLGDVRQVFADKGKDRLWTVELLCALTCMDESPWPTWSRGRELNARGLSRLLAPFGIHPQNVRTDAGVVKGYLRESFADAWERYLPVVASSTRYSATERINTSEILDPESATAGVCSGSQTDKNTSVDAGCSAVADRTAKQPVIPSPPALARPDLL